MADIVNDTEQNIRLTPLSKEHIGPILALMNQEGWYYYDTKELDRYLKLKEACFALIHDEKIIGSIFTTNYGNQAWLGNIIVSGKSEGSSYLYRNKGYAGQMIRHAMQVLSEKGVKTFRLGSVPTAIGAYKKVGFQAESFTTAQEAFLPLEMTQEETGLTENMTIEEMTLEDLTGDVVRIDKAFLKSDRLNLFRELYHDSIRESCLCLKDQGRIVGYIMIRHRTVSKQEGAFAEGPDYVYRLGPSCVLPEYGVSGFKALLQQALRPVNAEVERLGLSAKIYVVFPQNADKDRIYADFEAMGGTDADRVFNEHGHIFGATPLAKNDELWAYMKSLGFVQEYFEQTMSVTLGEEADLDPEKRAAHQILADGEGIFASATPGDKA